MATQIGSNSAEAADRQSPGEKPSDAIDLRTLGVALATIAQSDEPEFALDQLTEITARLTGARGVVYYSSDSTGELSADPASRQPDGFAESILDQLYRLAVLTHSQQSAQIARFAADDQSVAVAVPVVRRDQQPEVLALITPPLPDANRVLPGLVQSMQLIASFAAQWRGRSTEAAANRTVHAVEQLLQVLAESTAEEDLRSAGRSLAAGVRELLDCRLVAIGIRRGRHHRLLGVSHGTGVDHQSETVKALEAAMDEVGLLHASGSTVLPAGAKMQTDAWRSLRASFPEHEIEGGVLPGTDGHGIGACIVVSRPAVRHESWRTLSDLAEPLGRHLQLLASAQPGPMRRLFQQVAGMSAGTRVVLAALIIASALILGAMPVPHKIKCDCVVQPVKRRFVAAPYDGRLESVLVDPGDFVEQNQTIARMDGHEIRLELMALQKDFSRAQKQRDTSMAVRDTATAQIARLEMERLQLKIELLNDRAANLDIRSPIAGVVISGDPKKLEGARLGLGQTLVEVGPLRKMIAELAVEDEDIAHVKPGMQVRFRLKAIPHQEFSGTLQMLHSRSEERGGKNVFIGEVPVDDAQGVLRPGMNGQAKVVGEDRTLGWIIFHKAWEQLLFRIPW